MLWLLIALPVGILSALRPRSLLDRVGTTFTLIGISAHPVWLGLVLGYLFGFRLHWFPLAGYCDFIHPSGAEDCGGPTQWTYHLVLPWLTFALFFLPLYTRMIRARFIETMDAQYVVAARGRGVPELRLIRSHALRPALLPLVTMVGLDLGGALMAVIYIDSIYGLSGIGTLLLNGIADRVTGTYDLPLIAAIFFVVAAFTIFVTFVVDVLYAWLDPRVRIA